MRISKHISDLIENFKISMLPALADGDPAVFHALQQAHIEANALPFEFEAHQLFNAAWMWANECGLDMPIDTSYESDFKEFFHTLSQPWPDAALKAVKINIRRTKKSNSTTKSKYEIYNT